MSVTQIKPNTPISLNGKQGKIRYAASDVVLLGFADGKTLMLKPHELADWFDSGKLEILRREQATVLTTFKDEKESKKFDFIKFCLDKMDHHRTPTARGFVSETLAEAAAKFGWPDDKSIGPSTAIAWHAKWKNANYCYGAIIKKAKIKRRTKKSRDKYAFAAEIFDKHHLRYNGPTVANTYRFYLGEFEKAKQQALLDGNNDSPLGEPMSESSFYTFVGSFDAFEVMKVRKGTKAALRHFRRRGGFNETFFPMERIEVDALHLQIGLKITDENTGEEHIHKPIIYIAFDVYTRLVVGYHISVSEKASETANAVVQLIKHMADPYKKSVFAKNDWVLSGAPEAIYSDCGAAFVSRWVRSLIATINSTHHICEAASPWKKPFVERFNGTIKSQFATQMRGYVGNRKRGEVMDSTIEKIAVVTEEEFISEFERYILDFYHQSSHRGLDNKSPMEFYNEIKHLAPSIDPEMSKNIKGFAGVDRALTLTPSGINVNNQRYCSKALEDLYSNLAANVPRRSGNPKVTVLVNNDDISSVGVLDEFENDLFSVPCVDPKVQVGTPLYVQKATRRPRKSGNTKTFVSNVGSNTSTAANANNSAPNQTGTSNPEPEPLDKLSETLDDAQLDELLKDCNGLTTKDFSHIPQREAATEGDVPSDDDVADSEDVEFDDELEQF